MTHGACLGTDTLVAFIEGGTSAELRARVTVHASSCAACRELLSMLAAGSRPSSPRVGEAPARVGRYLVERELGAGGMGVVYAARDPELDRTVAIKLLHGDGGPEMAKRLRREAQVMAQLAHPHVVRVYDVGTSEGQIFIAMELVAGETLGHWERTRRPEREILARYREAGRGLAAAHAAGIVHRDFKPDNVLLGAGGAQVADFGLARSAGARLAPAPSIELEVSGEAPTVQASPDATNAIAGTPYYMAPELYDGGEADARSDQFAFAVALYTALFRERPFDGLTLDQLAANVKLGRIRPMRGSSRRVRAALRRALAVDPAARFASMTALLHALEPPRRAWIAIPAGLALAGGLVAGALVVTHAGPRCGGADEEVARAWGPVQRASLAVALTSTRLAYAEPTRREVERSLDSYATDWRAMRLGACEATRVHATQSEDVLALRMSCLDRRLEAIGDLARELAVRDPIRAAHAVTAARALPAIADCGDVAALTSAVRPPTAAIAARVAAVRGRLAKLDAERNAGHYREPLAPARALEGEVMALGYRPLEAELASLVGHLEEDAEHFPEARARFEQAVLAGDAGRDDPLVTRALIALAELLDHDLGKTAEADTVLARVRAQLERLDHPKELETDALVASGRNHLDAGRLDAGAADLERAIAAIEQHRGATDLELVEPLRVAASIEMQRTHPAVAHRYLDRALAIQRGVVGDQHPDYAYTIEGLAGVEYQEGHYDRAVALYRQALAVLEPTYGADGVTIAGVQANLANVLEWQGDAEGALAMFRRVAAVSATGFGPDHPRTLSARYGIGATLEDLGKHDEALAELTDVLARQQRVLGVHQETAQTLHMIAFVELWLHRYQPARDHARAALAMLKQTLGASYGGTDELATIGSAELGLGDPMAALAAFREAEAALEPEVDPGVKAYLDARYAQALIDSNTDRAKGLALYHAAYKILAADERSGENRAELDAWAKRRGIQ